MEQHSPQPCLDDLAHAADGGHNLAAYLVALLLYTLNGDASDDETTRRYIRWVEGEEVSWGQWQAMAAGQRVGG